MRPNPGGIVQVAGVVCSSSTMLSGLVVCFVRVFGGVVVPVLCVLCV